MRIEPYSPSMAREITELFYKCVDTINPSVYSAKQKAAWVAGNSANNSDPCAGIEYDYWAERLHKKRPFVVLVEDRIAGFMELEKDGHIDCAYTHPDFQQQGVASALFEHVLCIAKTQNIRRLYVEASLIAKPFFEHRGFKVLRRNQIQRHGVVLTNFSMEKHLSNGNPKQLKINVVDAFTEQQFKGNSAAVIITDSWLSEALMQSIATENNLSETAYLVKNKDGSYAIRWFSPITEIAFCGHATLASASVIFRDNPEQHELIFSADAVGKMTINRAEDGYIQMDFPNRKPTIAEQIPSELIEGLSIKPAKVLLNEQAYFAVYENENDVLNVTQEKEALKKLAPHDVVVTAPGSKYDFVSRYFWPANGGDEDPVTGSIHTGLAPYWSEQLGKAELLALQASKRSGILLCRVTQDRVFISGKAVHYLEGHINI